MGIKVAMLCLVPVLAAPLCARPSIDVVIMQNGDRFTCEIKKLDRGVLYAGFDYVDGTVSISWAKVARVESRQLFTVQTASGSVYTGTIRTAETPADQPVKIEVVELDNNEVPLDKMRIVELGQTSESLWRRFHGNLSSGLIYTRGNDTRQYNLSSALSYRRPRWEAQANFSSALSASEGATTSTRNQLTLDTLRLLTRKNWFVSGLANFLQSSQQGIPLQTTLGGGIGRFLKNTNRARISLTGGLAWQRTNYEASDSTATGTQDLVAGLIGGNVQVFKFKKTTLDLSANFLPALSNPGQLWFSTNATYSIQIINNLWWTFTFYGNWANKPPAGLPGSDYGSSSGITYSFN